MIVMKFGGSSVESANALERVAGIIGRYADRKPVVVVSAMGKTTNKLLAIGADAAAGRSEQVQHALEELKQYHLDESRPVVRSEDIPELEREVNGLFVKLGAELNEVAAAGEMGPRHIDAVSSFGERLSSCILTLVLKRFGMNSEHIDSRDVIITDGRHTQALPLFNKTYALLAEKVAPLASDGKVVVMGGFIASTTDGITTTLGRGGSDFTASIVGAGIGAEEIQIWTDVDGMLTCDPRILSGGHRVKVISFAEAAELAYFGAKVLHPYTVMPAIEKNIPVLILNSRRPDQEGTRIISETVPCTNPVKSIACKSNITVMNIRSARMLMAYGFLRKIFDVFDRYRTAVDVVATSEVSVSLTVDSCEHVEAIAEELRQIAEVSIEKDQAIICLVGERMSSTPGIAARVFGSLRDINVRMISQGASSLNLTLVVDSTDLGDAIQRLHDEFFSELDPAVFESCSRMQAV